MYALKRGFYKSVVKMDKPFELHTATGTLYGMPGDRIVTDLNNTQHLIDADEDIVEIKVIDKEAMAKGYEEMGDINLEEANASVHTYDDGMFK